MIGYRIACNVYGIRPLTAGQKEKLSDNEKIIRECKIDIINMCNEIRKAVKAIDQMAVNTKEINDYEEMQSLTNLRSELRSISSDITNIATTFTKDEVNG